MRTECRRSRPNERGYALLLTLVFISVCVVLLGSVFQWASNESTLTARNHAYNAAVAAAESAVEVAIAQMNRDFRHQSLASDVNTYSTVLPGALVANGWPSDYRFSDSEGNADRSEIVCKGWQVWTNVNSEFAGLYGMVNSYQITANARRITGPYPVAAAVRQDIQLTAIPIFQFAIFYALDLEINPGPPMVVTGKTHGNADIYAAPGSTLEFIDSVGAVGEIHHHRHPDDPLVGTPTTPIYRSTRLEGISSLTLPVGTDNNPSNVVKILDAPPADEDPNSELGRQRFYNKVNLIVITSNNTVVVTYNNDEHGTSFTSVPTNSISGGTNSGYTFAKTNVSFYDYREGKQVSCTEIDVKALTDWLAGSGSSFNAQAQFQTGHPINSIYVSDRRSAPGKLAAVRVTNGRQLPDGGLTVATPQPLYVKGHFNAADVTAGTTDTSQAKPAALVSDAISILSPNWNDDWSAATSLDNRSAANNTVNAAFLSGIVPSVTVDGQRHYSGGVENFPRFLENWTDTTFTYNGSMVVMFPSRYATNFWIDPGTYYRPPTRKWAFDSNFLDVTKLPAATPQVRKLQRGQWTVLAANGN